MSKVYKQDVNKRTPLAYLNTHTHTHTHMRARALPLKKTGKHRTINFCLTYEMTLFYN